MTLVIQNVTASIAGKAAGIKYQYFGQNQERPALSHELL